MAAPEMQQKILAIGLIPHESPSVEGIQRYIKAETEKCGTLVRQLGLEGSQQRNLSVPVAARAVRPLLSRRVDGV